MVSSYAIEFVPAHTYARTQASTQASMHACTYALLVHTRTATVWRRCSVAVVVDRWHCRPDVEGGGPLIR